MPANLPHSPEEIVAQLLIDSGLGGDPRHSGASWPVRATQEADSPDDCITVYGTAGVLQGRSQPDGDQYEKYGIQIRVRARTPRTGRAKLGAVADALDRVMYEVPVTCEATAYVVHSFSRKGTILTAGRSNPASKLVVLTQNMTVTLRTASPLPPVDGLFDDSIIDGGPWA